MNRIKLCFSIILTSLLFFSCHMNTTLFPVERGTLTLEGVDFSKERISLEGIWQFQKGLVLENSGSGDWGLSSLPGIWTEGQQGTATYKLLVTSAEPGAILAFRDMNTVGARSYFINGEYIGGSGQPGQSQEEEQPGLKMRPLSFSVPAEEFEILIQISNYHFRDGGLSRTIYLGESGKMNQDEMRYQLPDILIIGVMFIIIMIYLTMFLKQNKDLYLLFFSGLCISFMLWISFNNSCLYTLLLPDATWNFVLKSSFLGGVGAVFFLLLFVSWFQSPPRFPRLERLQSTFLGFIIFLILSTKPEFFSRLLSLINFVFMLSLFYVLVELFYKIRKRVIKARWLLPGQSIFFIFVLYDLIINPENIDASLITFGVSILIIQQTLFHADLNIRTFKKLLHLNKEYEEINQELEESLNQIEAQTRQLDYIHQRDILTDLPNRTQLLSVAERELSFTANQDVCLTLLVIEIGDYKHLSDRLGQAAHDKALRALAKNLSNFTSEMDWVCRYAQDRFVILFSLAEKEIELRCTQLLESIHSKDLKLYFGAADCRESRNAEMLLRKALTALEHSRKKEPWAILFYSEALHNQTLNSLDLEESLKMALQKKEVEVYYQPQVSSENRSVLGLEALIRWKNPEGGYYVPEHFIALAEERGLIRDLDLYVLSIVMDQIALWEGTALESVRVAVNISADHFVKENFVAEVLSLLEEKAVSAKKIELELTESVLVYNKEQVGKNIKSLQASGFTIALDDFGTGYSSLSYLSDFSVDILKIDKSFVTNLSSDPRKKGIISSIINIGRSLGMKVVAEGVEKEEEWDYLCAEGCDFIQGFLISEAKPAEEIILFAQE